LCPNYLELLKKVGLLYPIHGPPIGEALPVGNG
jgi:hypothetical protein